MWRLGLLYLLDSVQSSPFIPNAIYRSLLYPDPVWPLWQLLNLLRWLLRRLRWLWVWILVVQVSSKIDKRRQSNLPKFSSKKISGLWVFGMPWFEIHLRHVSVCFWKAYFPHQNLSFQRKNNLKILKYFNQKYIPFPFRLRPVNHVRWLGLCLVQYCL